MENKRKYFSNLNSFLKEFKNILKMKEELMNEVSKEEIERMWNEMTQTCSCDLTNVENKLDLINGGIMQLNNTTNEMYKYLQNNMNGGSGGELPDIPDIPIKPDETAEIDKWIYKLDEENNVVTLNKLKTKSELENIELGEELIVYDKYIINDKEYSTKLASEANETKLDYFINSNEIKTIKFGNFIDISKITQCTNFIQGSNINNVEWGAFSSNNIITINGLFNYNGAIVSSNILDKFDFSKVTSLSKLFYNCSALEDISFLNKIDFSKMTKIYGLIYNYNVNIKIKNFDITMDLSSYISDNYDKDILFNNSSLLNEELHTFSGSIKFKGTNENIINIKIDTQMINSLKVSTEPNSQLKFDCEGMFLSISSEKKSLTTLDLSEFKPLEITNFRNFVSNQSLLSEIIGLSDLDVSKATSLAFDLNSTCISELDLSKWVIPENYNPQYNEICFPSTLEKLILDNQNILHFARNYSNSLTDSEMFNKNIIECANTLKYLSLKNCKISNGKILCKNLSNLETINLFGIDTSEFNSTYSMFSGCKKLSNIIGFNGLNISNVTDMSFMFDNCESLGSLDLSKWNIPNVLNISGMFRKTILENLILPKNISSVTNIYNLFSNANINTINGIENITSDSIGFFQNSFQNLTTTNSELDLTHLSVLNAKNMSFMFSNSINITSILVSRDKWIIPEGCSTSMMFNNCGCSEVTYVD